MSELEEHPFASGPGKQREVTLRLYRRKNEKATPVLLLHGASASKESFRIPGPDPAGRPRSLTDWLHGEGFEPWLLDWRGSGRVVDEATLERLRDEFDFDRVAQYDIPGALKRIREVTGAERICALGHCMGAGTLAQAIAGGFVTPEHRLTRVVLLTLGLFYEPPFDSRLKTQDHVLDHLLEGSPEVLSVDPRPGARWPDALEEIYRNWPTSLRPHRESELPGVHEMCDRLSFMYGAPYLEQQLVPEIHDPTSILSIAPGDQALKVGQRLEGVRSGAAGVLSEIRPGNGDAAGELVVEVTRGSFESNEALKVAAAVVATCVAAKPRALLLDQFGAIPIKMYVHGARNARRRWAARFERPNDDVELIAGDGCRDGFRRLEGMTLITGAKNQLWHRDSVDRMHAWLTRGAGSGEARRRFQRVILPDYGHQDLLWGARAPEDVFPSIVAGLRLERAAQPQPAPHASEGPAPPRD